MVEPNTASDTAGTTAREFDLGVLLVHGIGQQKKRQTLTEWGDVLVQSLEQASSTDVRLQIDPATKEDVRGDRDAMILTIQDGASSQTWLLSEAWWADVFSQPSYAELVSLSFRAIPWTIASHFVHRNLHRGGEYENRRAEYGDKGIVVLQLILGLLLSPLLLLLLLLMLVVGLLPVPRLRSFVMEIQAKLSATVGDCLVYSASPTGAASIVGVVRDSIKEMRGAGCRRVAVVAHSQGAAVTLDAMGGILPRLDDTSNELPTAPDEIPEVDLLVTFGAGIKKLALLKWQLAAAVDVQRPNGKPATDEKVESKNAGVDPVQRATWSFVGCVALLSIVVVNLAIGKIQLVPQLKFLGLLILGGVFLALLGATLAVVSKRMKKTKHFSNIMVSIITAFLLGYTVLLIVYGEKIGAQGMQLSFLIATFGASIGWCREILFGGFAHELEKHIVKPPSVATWFDLYASGDPVSAGKTHIDNDSQVVWNEGSMLNDHTIYWKNLDGFVLRVLHHLLDLSGLQDLVTPHRTDFDRMARRRVQWLRAARYLLPLSWVASGLVSLYHNAKFWNQAISYFDKLDLLGILPVLDVVEHPWLGRAMVSLMTGIASWILYRIVRYLWQWWDKAERQRALAGKADIASSRWQMSFVVVFTLTLLLAIGGCVAVVRSAVP